MGTEVLHKVTLTGFKPVFIYFADYATFYTTPTQNGFKAGLKDGEKGKNIMTEEQAEKARNQKIDLERHLAPSAIDAIRVMLSRNNDNLIRK